jgi:hypothetical protein
MRKQGQVIEINAWEQSLGGGKIVQILRMAENWAQAVPHSSTPNGISNGI